MTDKKITSKRVLLEGKAMWAKVFESNRDPSGYKGAWEEDNGRTCINMLLDEENYDKLQRSGSLKRGKQEGPYMNVKFDRKWESDKEWECGPPEVLGPDGNPWSLEEDGAIGNMSVVRVELVVTHFPQSDSYSTRLERLKVLKLEQYDDIDSLMTRDETALDSPPQESPPMHHADVEDLESDEIPF